MKLKDQRGQMARHTILLILSTIIATCLVIFGLILPAYYSIDPLGWGAKLGLNGAVNQLKNNNVTGLTLKPQPTATIAADASQQQASAQTAPAIDPLEQQQNTFELSIPPRQSLDYRLKMERDFELDYTWKTDGKPLYAELRGESANGKPGDSKLFGKPLLGNAGQGFFIAPFSGKFGWHWVNKSAEDIKVRVTAKGMYQIVEQLNAPKPM